MHRLTVFKKLALTSLVSHWAHFHCWSLGCSFCSFVHLSFSGAIQCPCSRRKFIRQLLRSFRKRLWFAFLWLFRQILLLLHLFYLSHIRLGSDPHTECRAWHRCRVFFPSDQRHNPRRFLAAFPRAPQSSAVFFCRKIENHLSRMFWKKYPFLLSRRCPAHKNSPSLFSLL